MRRSPQQRNSGNNRSGTPAAFSRSSSLLAQSVDYTNGVASLTFAVVQKISQLTIILKPADDKIEIRNIAADKRAPKGCKLDVGMIGFHPPSQNHSH